jgi:glucose-1-phosphate thymidylyltransferase
MAIVGVVPAAGYAVRLQPLDCSKEVLPVAGRPVIDYLVERMRVGGAERIRIVTREAKDDVIAYGEDVGAEVILGSPAHLDESFAAGLEGLDGDDIALLGYPDSLWDPLDGYKTLVAAVEGGEDIALGLFHVPGLPGADFLEFDGDGNICDIHIKPAGEAPSDWMWGAMAARVSALDGLAHEEWPSGYLNLLLGRGKRLWYTELSSEYLDIGTPQTLEALGSSRWVA